MEFIFRWVAGALALILAKYANPQLQADLDTYHARTAKAEAAEKAAVEAENASKAAYAVSVANRAGWDEKIKVAELQIVQSQQRLEESRVRIKAIEDEAADAKKKLDGLSPSDRVRVDL